MKKPTNNNVDASISTFEKGMHLNFHNSVQPQGTYPFALNIIHKDPFQDTYRSNEHGNIKISSIDDKIAGTKYIKQLDKIVVITKIGKIYLVNANAEEYEKPKFIFSFDEFGCQMEYKECEDVKIVVTSNGCELLVTWSSNDIYYFFNLTEMLDEKRKASLIKKITNKDCNDCNSDCDYFKVFKSVCNTIITGEANQTGGSLPAGAYVYSARLLNSNGLYTNYSLPSKPFFIGSEHNIPGEDSRGRISLTFKNLDCNYNKIEIAVTHYTSSSIITRLLSPVYYNKDTFTFEHVSVSGIPIDTSEVLEKKFTTLSGNNLYAYENRMYYYGIKSYKDYNVQKIANNVRIKIVAEKYSYETVKKYQIRTLPYGENIALGLVINHDDGTHSAAAHIPCNSSGVGNLNFGALGGGSNQGLSGTPSSTSSSSNDNNNNSNSNSDSNSNVPDFNNANNNTDSNITVSPITTDKPFNRIRTSIDNTVSNLSNDDELLDIEKQLVDSYTTEIEDLVKVIKPVCPDSTGECTDCGDGDGEIEITNTVTSPDGTVSETSITGSLGGGSKPKNEINQFCNRNNAEKDGDVVNKDIKTAEKIAVKWASILEDYIGHDGKKDLIKLFKPSNIKEAAQGIIKSIRERERIVLNKRIYSLDKKTDYSNSNSSNSSNNTPLKSLSFGLTSQTGKDDNKHGVSLLPTYPGGEVVAVINPKCKEEKGLKYPCIRDCDGNLVFGSNSNQNVKHFKLPDEHEIDPWLSNSIGVPSVMTPDADEYSDVYITVLGLQAFNVNIDKEEYFKYTGKKVCKKNPFTIVQVEINNSNKTILTKGLITTGFVSSNQGKDYIYQKPAVNSFETVNKYIDKGDENRWEQNPKPSSSVFLYSLDQSVLKPYIGSATKLKFLKKLSGVGYTHHLYAKGKSPSNKTYGRQLDQRGTVSATNLHQSSNASDEYDIKFITYANANSAVAPPNGGEIPLMNKYGQECLWIGLDREFDIKDRSFVGVTLNHHFPIDEAFAHYVAVTRELDIQYGALDSLMYITALEAVGDVTSVRGLPGNRFISPYSYIKTHFISDKVGNKFPISNMVSGKSDRCICDTPEDAVNSLIGKNFWTDIPKDSDPADPKNWAGTHTPGDARTLSYEEVKGINQSQSGYYYPGTLTHLNTFIGESEANPFMLELSDLLQEQRYPFIKPQFELDSNAPEKHNWEDCYLNNFYVNNQQPSAAEKLMKVLTKSIINLVLPMLELSDLLSPDGALELTGDLINLPMMIAIYLLLSKVLFTDDFIDEFIGLPKCKTDKEGGIEFKIEKFFKNYNKYSYIYSKSRDLYQFVSQKDAFNCGCNNKESRTNEVFISEEQMPNSRIINYNLIRPFNSFNFNEESGTLIDLFTSLDGGLAAHTTDSIWVLKSPNKTIPTSDGENIVLSSSTIKPRLAVGTSTEGYGGILHRNHAIDTMYGRIFLDYEADTLFIYTGGRNLKPINKNGIDYLFKNYTKFCETNNCCNELNDSKCYFILGLDPRFKRLLITKSSLNDLNSWTISIKLDDMSLISFHSYIPNKYISTRSDMILIKDNSFYTHKTTNRFNNKNNCVFFGKEYPFFIESRVMFNKAVNFTSIAARTSVDKINLQDNIILYNRKIFFDQIALWNSYQSGGNHNILPIDVNGQHLIDTQSDKNETLIATFVNNEWRINEFHDYTIDYSKPLISYDDICSPMYKPTNYSDISDRKIQNFKNRILRDNHLNIRLLKNNLMDSKLYLKNLVILHNHKPR